MMKIDGMVCMRCVFAKDFLCAYACMICIARMCCNPLNLPKEEDEEEEDGMEVAGSDWINLFISFIQHTMTISIFTMP